MRDLIFLSEDKLGQFRVRPGRWDRLRRAKVAGEVSVPGVAGLKVEDQGPATGGGASLDAAIDALEAERKPAWYAAPGVAAGQWVAFECRLNYRILGTDLVVFVDDPDEGSDAPRLLLHGSVGHLLDQVPTVSTRELDRAIGGELGMSNVHRMYQRAVGWLAAEEGELEAETLAERQHLEPTFRRLLASLDAFLSSATVAPMSGHARVSAVVGLGRDRRLVVATPLYVQYA